MKPKRTVKKYVRDWKASADSIGIGLDLTWIRHIKETTKCTQEEAEAEFKKAVETRALRADSTACQIFMKYHGMSAYIFYKQ